MPLLPLPILIPTRKFPSQDNVHATRDHSGDIPLEVRANGAPETGHTGGIPDAAPLDDEDIDLGPFAIKPYKLASLLDPKDLNSLEAIGGLDCLLAGLGADPMRGLWVEGHGHRDGRSSDGRPGAGAGASQRHDRHSEVKQDSLETKVISVAGDDGENKRDPFRATLQERKRVYGENLLPHRQSKSLFRLMWLAFKDKVLVSIVLHHLVCLQFSFIKVLLSIAAVISLALGLFQDFGTPREPGDPPVDWVEGVAIMIAILIVVCPSISYPHTSLMIKLGCRGINKRLAEGAPI